jgi:predicted RNA methylase
LAGFFDDYSAFFETSITGASAERLNARYRAIIQPNRHLLQDRRVLDLASHDGRWSFTALHAGAAHVTGIEGRQHLVTNANRNLTHCRVAPNRYEFILGDVFEVMKQRRIQAQTVLVLGFFYHTDRHVELAALIAATGASNIILDTNILPARQNNDGSALVKLFEEPTASEANALGAHANAIVGHPSREAIKLIFAQHRFEVVEFDWRPFRGSAELADYNDDRRSTFVLSRS